MGMVILDYDFQVFTNTLKVPLDLKDNQKESLDGLFILKTIINVLNFLNYFDLVVTSHKVGSVKPEE